jgi:serine/threonine protein phosphatase PrpC
MLAVCDGHGGDTTVNKLQASLEAAYKTALEGMASVA